MLAYTCPLHVRASDVLHMTIDNATFAVNLYAQVKKDRHGRGTWAQAPIRVRCLPVALGHHRCSSTAGDDEITGTEIGAAALSGLALLATTFYVVYEAADRLITKEVTEEINADLMLVFTCIGLLFDTLSICVFGWGSDIHGHAHAHGAMPGHAHGLPEQGVHSRRCCGRFSCNINMFSAFMHVQCDFLRSISGTSQMHSAMSTHKHTN